MIRINSSFENPRYNLVKDSKKVRPIEPITKIKNKKQKSYQKTLKYQDDNFEQVLKDKKDN